MERLAHSCVSELASKFEKGIEFVVSGNALAEQEPMCGVPCTGTSRAIGEHPYPLLAQLSHHSGHTYLVLAYVPGSMISEQCP